ncbi:YCF48-related protein [Lacinutrix iliipiscaria]|uniref:YCF48-related protein n=1 Tax=Lacinutrix iliipiscaria TaxID=1230532 RepID=A0ABW5WSJ5_9FLAO
MKFIKKYLVLIIVVFSFFSQFGLAQEWQTLNVNTLGWRFEDMQFVDPDIGWVVDGGGQILKTIDGGENWTQQYYNSDRYFRSVEFYDDQIGYAGTLANGNPAATLLRTTDGGANWEDISSNFPVDVVGICGMHAVNENTIFVTGVFYGNAYIIKSVNQGNSWSYIDMGSLCNGLVDIFFKDENIGFAVGQSAQGTGLKSIIVGTTNGGETWSQLAIGAHNNQRAWKLQMISEDIIYASVEEFEPTPQYFKSIDGGQTWNLETVITDNDSGTMQGIGFLNEDIGWVGGFGLLFYETLDGGATWEYQPTIGSSFNRFQRVNDTLMYTSGVNVYKYVDPSLLSVDEFEIVSPKGHEITILGSNVVDEHAQIHLNLINNTYCEISVYNMQGQRVQTLVEGRRVAGEHTIPWDASALASGNYFLALYTYHGYESIRVVVK